MKVAIIGAGVMGLGISHAFATNAESDVWLCPYGGEAPGAATVAARIRREVEKGRLTPQNGEAAAARVRDCALEDLSDADLVIECIIENVDIKRELFLALDKICGPQALFASDTSSLSITGLGRGLKHPLIGLHFFNPAEVMKLVEIIIGLDTPPEMVEKVKAIIRSIGKNPIEVTESPGFAVNRILIPMINEGITMLAEGVASAEDIETAMKLGANHPMGPLALGDLIGLDVCLTIMDVLYRETGDGKYRPHPLLRKMVRAGYLGRKTGRGFFEYPPEPAKGHEG